MHVLSVQKQCLW